jgi:hypothetical protein
MRLPRFSAASFIVIATALPGCGGRTEMDDLGVVARIGPSSVSGPIFDAGVVVEPDGAVIVPDGDTIEQDGAVVAPDGAIVGHVPPRPPPTPPPSCTLMSTCSTQDVLLGSATTAGIYNVETVYLRCENEPTGLEQLEGTSWAYSPPMMFQAGEPATFELYTYEVLPPPGTVNTVPSVGLPAGSVAWFRACILDENGDVLACDAPAALTITGCGACGARQCLPGYFVDDDCKCVVKPPPIHPVQ